MEITQAIFLGLVQGITEVLPISSSGHLVLVPWFFDFSDPGLSFDVALHLGTLLAILTYFRRDWINIIKGFFSVIKSRKITSPAEKLPFFILLATVPGALAGYFLESQAESAFRNPLLIALTTFIFAVILLIAEKTGRKKEDKNRNWKNALITGVAQALAIVPGVSRSGVTMSGGMFLGFNREAAARFSFLISAPIIMGATVFSLRDSTLETFASPVFWGGFLAAIGASFISVKFLMNFVRSHKLNIFAYYRFLLVIIIVTVYFLGGK